MSYYCCCSECSTLVDDSYTSLRTFPMCFCIATGHLGIVDFDEVELSNLHRQVCVCVCVCARRMTHFFVFFVWHRLMLCLRQFLAYIFWYKGPSLRRQDWCLKARVNEAVLAEVCDEQVHLPNALDCSICYAKRLVLLVICCHGCPV